MPKRNSELIAAMLKLAHSTRVHRVFSDAAAGRGVIFMLHKIGPHNRTEVTYPPNEDLIVTPEFLGEMINRVRALDYDIVSMDEAVERLAQGADRRFAVFTLDDAYRDTLEVAYPVLRAAGVPFTVYVPTAWADGRGLVKWAVLEALTSAGIPIQPQMEGLPQALATASAQQRRAAFESIDGYLNRLGSLGREPVLRAIAERHDVDVDALCREQIMTWDEIRLLARDELVTIGAHSVDHLELSTASREQLTYQLAESKARVEAELGRPCRHFAYPYGDIEAAGPREFAHAAAAGFTTAVTTRRGVVHDHHQVRLTELPRIAITGRMEDWRCMEMLISGVPDMVLNGFRTRVA